MLTGHDIPKSLSLRALFRDTRGNILLMAAAAMPLLIGAAGLASDTVMWALWNRESQRAADSASLAGALTIQQAIFEGEKAALHDFKKSKAFKDLKGKIIINTPPKDGPWSGDESAVYVRVEIEQVLPFSNFFLKKAPLISASATAAMAPGGDNCILGLDPVAPSAVLFTGNSSLKLNCGVMSNSSNSVAVSAEGTASVAAPAVSGRGGVPASSNYSSSTKLYPNAIPQVDPWSALEQPKLPKPCNPKLVVASSQSLSISPGCYAGMELDGSVSLSPGIYFITAGDLSIESQAQVTGQGVTFILLNDPAGKTAYYPKLKIAGGATVNFTAPSYGPYTDLLMFQDRNAPFSSRLTNVIAGNSSSSFRGDLYFPNQQIDFTGNLSARYECFRIIARRITFTGTSEFSGDCPTSHKRYARKGVRLVG